MVAQMVVDIRNQDVEDHPTIKFMRVDRRLRAVLREHIDKFGIAAAVAILQSHHRQRGEEWNTGPAVCGRSDGTEAPAFGQRGSVRSPACECRRVAASCSATASQTSML